MPFNPSAQTANTVKEVAVCTDCEKPRVIYASKKLPNQHARNLELFLSQYSYTCGAVLQEMKSDDSQTSDINKLLELVFVRANLTCSTSVEVPYYSCESFKDVCFYCGSDH